MKSLPKILSLLTISTMMVSCNEKISPELQSGNSSTTTPPTTTTSSSNFVFKLEQDSNLLLRYKMHKTGEDNNNIECKIQESTFSTSLFKSAPGTYDITCYLEAEEQSLYYNGVDLKLTASANLCENVVYAPFNFFRYQPGSSSRSVNLYRCAADLNNSMIGTYRVDQTSPLLSVSQAACDNSVDMSGTVTSKVGRYTEQDQDLCDFDYKDSEGPNCDSGVISINEITISKSAAYCESGGTIDTAITSEADCTAASKNWQDDHLQASPAVNRIHKCGGSISKCRGGVGLAGVQSTFKGLIAQVDQSVKDTLFVKDITLPSPSASGHETNMGIANFVRQCSGSVDNSSSINFSDVAPSTTALTERKKFDPNVLDRYSIGIEYWDTAATSTDGYFSIKTSAYTNYHSPRSSAANNKYEVGWTKTYYAADSFMTTQSAINASGSVSKAASNPFYAFYCLNNALDIKARIRLVVRDWDQFPDYSGQDFELLSDIFQQPTATPENGRMDTVGIEIDDDSNPFNDLNDVVDWDDFFRDQTFDLVPGPARAFNDRCSAREPGHEAWYSPILFPGSGL
jgi:hypothetical protein